MEFEEVKKLLDQKVIEFNSSSFISSDPISIPHQFSKKEDIEISAFLVATIAWGQRTTIIKNGNRLCELMDNAPFEFISQHQEHDLSRFESFKHRTFNSQDLIYFIRTLKRIYQEYGSLENVFHQELKEGDQNLFNAIEYFREEFFKNIKAKNYRTQKHVSSPAKGSAAKRLLMFLKWMVRKDSIVDFGIWKSISPSILSCPLDVHSGNVARKLGVLKRKQNDWKAVEELDITLRKFDSNDPAKYDYALFGLGIFEGWK